MELDQNSQERIQARIEDLGYASARLANIAMRKQKSASILGIVVIILGVVITTKEVVASSFQWIVTNPIFIWINIVAGTILTVCAALQRQYMNEHQIIKLITLSTQGRLERKAAEDRLLEINEETSSEKKQKAERELRNSLCQSYQKLCDEAVALKINTAREFPSAASREHYRGTRHG